MERARIARVITDLLWPGARSGAGAQHLVWICAATLRWFLESRTYPTFHVTCQMKTRLTTPTGAPRIRRHVTVALHRAARRHRAPAPREPGRARVPHRARPHPQPGLPAGLEGERGADLPRPRGEPHPGVGHHAAAGERGTGQHGAPARRVRPELRRRPGP